MNPPNAPTLIAQQDEIDRLRRLLVKVRPWLRAKEIGYAAIGEIDAVCDLVEAQDRPFGVAVG